MLKQVLAVDGDTIAYRTAAACEGTWEGACEDIIASTLRKISTATGIHEMRIYLSGQDNYRYEVAKTKPYKGNRVGMIHPEFLNHCKEHLVQKYGAIRMHGYEADDGIATDMVENGAIHCGVDKDILQIAGRHYMYVKEEWVEVSEEQAIITRYRQILMGDTSDNIPGLPGVGAKTAERVICDADTALSDALIFYEDTLVKKGLTFTHESKPGEPKSVNPLVYFAEQDSLITMVTDCEVFEILFDKSVYIEPESEGFTAQEGDFNG